MLNGLPVCIGKIPVIPSRLSGIQLHRVHEALNGVTECPGRKRANVFSELGVGRSVYHELLGYLPLKVRRNDQTFGGSKFLCDQLKKTLVCRIDDKARSLLELAINKQGLSARAYDRILKVARTIADLAECEEIDTGHVAEAIHYRTLDRHLWL